MITKVNFTIKEIHLMRACCALGMMLGPGNTLVNATGKVPALSQCRLRTAKYVKCNKTDNSQSSLNVFNWVLISNMEIVPGNSNHLESNYFLLSENFYKRQ